MGSRGKNTAQASSVFGTCRASREGPVRNSSGTPPRWLRVLRDSASHSRTRQVHAEGRGHAAWCQELGGWRALATSRADMGRASPVTRPRPWARAPMMSFAVRPRSRSERMVVEPTRFARRSPAALTTIGTCAYDGDLGGGDAQEAHQEDLPRRRGEEVVGANHVRDAHRRVVDRDHELIRVHAVAAAQHEVADADVHVLLEPPAHEIVEGHRRAVRDAEPDRRRALHLAVARRVATRPRVDDLLAGVRRARDTRDLRPRAVAGIGEPRRRELRQPGVVERGALRLRVRCMYPPASGPSSQSRPSQARSSAMRLADPLTTRGVSMSSTRSTVAPPAARASAQEASAVQAPPTWRSPVGEGAKRVRIIAVPRAYRASRRSENGS